MSNSSRNILSCVLGIKKSFLSVKCIVRNICRGAVSKVNKELDNRYIILQFNTLGDSFNLGLNFCSQKYDNCVDIDLNSYDYVFDGYCREFYILLSLIFCQITIGFKFYKK